MMNSETRNDSVDGVPKGSLVGIDLPTEQNHCSHFYAEMVGSYMTIYAEYADQVLEHSKSYSEERACSSKRLA
jgi:hypothetical protein